MTSYPPPGNDPNAVPDPSQKPDAYPPPPGSYPPPAPGSYPPPGSYSPPPVGSYPPPTEQFAAQGFPPPPPQFGDYQPPPAFSVGSALSYGFNKFKANPATWIVAMIAFIVISAIAQLPQYLVDSFAGLAISFVLLLAVSSILQLLVVQLSLRETDGATPSIADVFGVGTVVSALPVALSVVVISDIGFILLILPGIVATFLLWFSAYFALDKRAGVGDALKSSFRLVSDNIGPLLLLALVSVVLLAAGVMLCGVGLLVAGPVVAIANAYAFRSLTGGVVSPAQP